MFENFKNFKNKVALFDDKKEVKYSEILDYSNYLKQIIKKNSLVLLVISNSLEGLKIYSSLIYNNTTTIIIDESLGKKYAFDLIKKYKVNYLFIPKKLINISKEKNIINESDNYFFLLKNKFNHKINKKNLVLLPTSGTTANPKFVRLSENNLAFNSKKIIGALSISKNEVAYTSLPSGFSFGLSILNTHLNIGAKIFVTKSSIVEKKFWNNLSKYKITSLYGVPSMFKFICISKLYNKIPNNVKYLAQAGGKLDLDVKELGVDMMSLSGHKIKGPKGVGCLYIKKGIPIAPIILGGGQERQRRSGTENVPGIVGFSKSLVLADNEKNTFNSHCKKLVEELRLNLKNIKYEYTIVTPTKNSLSNILNICFKGFEGEPILIGLDMDGIFASSGSACSSASLEPSHVLISMGIDPKLAIGSIRFSFSMENIFTTYKLGIRKTRKKN